MFLYQTFIIAVLIACSIYACYTDFKYRKIKNMISLGLVGFGIFNHIIYFSFGGIVAKENLITSVILIIGGCLLGMVLYVFGIWSAGDAKLFWGFSVAAPPMLFTTVQSSGNTLPLMMLENIFVVYLIFIVLNLLLKTSLREKISVFIEAIKNNESLKSSLKSVFLDLSFFLLLVRGGSLLSGQYVFPYISPMIFGILAILFIIIINRLIEKHGLEKYRNFISPLCLIGVLLIPSLRILYLILVPIIFFVAFLLRPFIWQIGQKVYIRDLNFNALTQGTIPAERIFQVTTANGQINYEKEPATFPKRKKDKIVLDVSSKGISHSKIEEVQKLWRDGAFQQLGDTIKVQEHVSLAGVICLGCLLTILCKTTLIAYLRYLL